MNSEEYYKLLLDNLNYYSIGTLDDTYRNSRCYYTCRNGKVYECGND